MGLSVLSLPRVIENDALVVLAFPTIDTPLTHFGFREKAKALGFELTRSQSHNMLHRALGRVTYTGVSGPNQYEWRLTVQGIAYRHHVITTLNQILRFVNAAPLDTAPAAPYVAEP